MSFTLTRDYVKRGELARLRLLQLLRAKAEMRKAASRQKPPA